MLLGMDVSSMEETVRLGGRFFENGKEDGLLSILSRRGVSAVRLRLWNDPYAPDGASYGAGGCDLDCVIRQARQAKEHGMRWMLDLHYSDFWCDPSRQLPPKAWEKLPFSALTDAVYAFTHDTLLKLRQEDLVPDWVQVGNEITGGMLWPQGRILDGAERQASFDRLCALVDAGARAVREGTNARIVLHLESSGDNARYREWFDRMCAYGVPFDVIGMSYYPFWHGGLAALGANMDDMARRYGRDVMIVETAYPFTGCHYDKNSDGAALVINDSLRMSDGSAPPYPFTPAGQAAFLRALWRRIALVPDGRGAGLWYWEPAWLPVPGSSWSSPAARAYIHEEDKRGGNEWANQCLFDYEGRALPALAELCALTKEGTA